MYLLTTSFLPLILKVDGERTILYVDGAHAAVHADTKEHADVYTIMERGAAYASSTKSKISTVSSTEI